MHLGQLKADAAFPGLVYDDAPRNVYWEMTVACDLACRHCRADAIKTRDPHELSFEDACGMIRDIKQMGSMLILTGGDPLKRPDIFDIIAYGRSIGVPISVTPSTTPTLTRGVIEHFKSLGVAALGMSIDGPTAQLHDAFRGVPGTFDRAMKALRWASEFGLPVQVNTTVSGETMQHLPALYGHLRTMDGSPVRRWSLFLLIPVGRGTKLTVPTAQQVEDLFAWVYDVAQQAPFHVGTVEAPQYRRYWIQRKLAEGMPPAAITQAAKRQGLGVRDGNGVIFVSHRGDVFPAGFLPYPVLGNVREEPLSQLYREAPQLLELRNMENLRGACGRCEFRWACGGSRARAYAMTGDAMETDPLCALAVAGAPA